MTIDLYYVPGSAPCRSVLLAARAVGVDLNLKLTNLMEGAHLTPEFLKVKYLVNCLYIFISLFPMTSVLVIFPSWEGTRIHSVQFPVLYAFQEGNS
jgi:hypothetical protein